MIPKNRIPAHPGEILLEEFLNPNGLSQVDLARHLNVTTQYINEIIRGKREISSETAWLLSQAFGTTPEFWLNLQIAYNLARNRPKKKVTKLQIVTLSTTPGLKLQGLEGKPLSPDLGLADSSDVD